MRHFARTLVLGLCFIAAAGGLFAQAQDLQLDYFGEEKGLGTTNINDIFSDSRGFLWLATATGLARFDGYTFKFFRKAEGDSASLAFNHVMCMNEDAEGNIWCGLLRGGASCYNRRTGKFRNYPITERLRHKTATVHRIFFDKTGQIWLGVSQNGILKLDKRTGEFQQFEVVNAQTEPETEATQIPTLNVAYNFWQADLGKIWLATAGLYLFDPASGRIEPHRSPKPLAGENLNTGVYAIHGDGDLLWVGGWACALRSYNTRTGEWRRFLLQDPRQPVVTNVIDKILPKNEDELWVSSTDRGLGIFNKKTERFFFFAHDSDQYPDMPKTSVGQICHDRQGNLWANFQGKLARIQLRDKRFHFHPVPQTKPVPAGYNRVDVLFEDRDGRFRFTGFPGGDGLQVLDKRTGKTTVPAQQTRTGDYSDDRRIMDIRQAPDGTIWVLSRHFIYRFNPQTMQLEAPQPQPPIFSKTDVSNQYNQMALDLDGRLWLTSSSYGIHRWDPRTGETRHFMAVENDPNALPCNITGAIACDRRGRIWFGSASQTAYGYFPRGQDRCVRLDPNGKPTAELTSMRLHLLFTDAAGDMWVCSEQGLQHFDCAGEEPRQLKKYTVADGLSADYVGWAVALPNGQVWAHAGSLNCLDVATGKVTVFTYRDGFPKSVFGLGRLHDGHLYMKGDPGYYTFHPDSLAPVRRRAPLALTSFRVDDQEQYAGSEPVPVDPLVVPADSRYFSLEFAALDFVSAEELEYEYLFEGFDNQWVKAGQRRFFSFTNVPAGHYKFKVKLAGAPDAEALVVPLEVRVSFYKTSWFWLLVAAFAAGAVARYFQIRQRQRQQVADLESRAQQLEKEKAVVMYESLKQQLNPHFLFNSLTSLSSLIQIDARAAVRFLENLSKTYRYILKSSERDTVPLSEELKFAEAFVKLQKTRFEAGLEVRFEVAEEFFHRKIVPVTVQNLLENAVKHNIIDAETPLVVEVFVADDCLVVRNNLQKKSFVETSNKRGLANLRSFYRYLSEREIETTEADGFFTIRIPLI